MENGTQKMRCDMRFLAGAIPAGGSGLLDAEATLEFHRLYSAIFFLTNIPQDDGEPQV
jgi:hypothetical protein